jgi:pimeloyl-ACP methyl ester carboxylesterase
VGVQGLPVLAIWGANDVIVRPDNWQELNRRIPQARLVKVEGVGHEITYARPKVVGDALIDFWSGLNLNR